MPGILIAAVVGILFLGILLVVHWSSTHQSDYATMVRANDAALQKLAETTGLTFTAGRTLQHPMVGEIAAFGTVRGMYRGFRISLSAVSDAPVEPPITFHTEFVLEPPSNAPFRSVAEDAFKGKFEQLIIEPSRITFQPRTLSNLRSSSYRFFIVIDPAVLLKELDGLCDFGETLLVRI